MADDDEDDITIADLYPELSPDEQADAEYRLLGYLTIVQNIWDRYEQEGRLNPRLRVRLSHISLYLCTD